MDRTQNVHAKQTKLWRTNFWFLCYGKMATHTIIESKACKFMEVWWNGVYHALIATPMIATNLIESMLIEMIVFKITNMIDLLVDMVGLISFFDYKDIR